MSADAGAGRFLEVKMHVTGNGQPVHMEAKLPLTPDLAVALCDFLTRANSTVEEQQVAGGPLDVDEVRRLLLYPFLGPTVSTTRP